MSYAPQIGANTWIWVSPLTDERLAELAPKIKRWGFDFIELPIERPGEWDPARAAALLGDLGLGATCCAVMSPERDLLVDDLETVHRTQRYLERCIEIAATVGGSILGGPIYAATGRTWRMDEPARRAALERLAGALRPVVEHAGAHGVRLAIEPLNRFETSLLNTVEQALELLARLDSLVCGLLLDTFHMNIEERDLPSAIRAAGPHLFHIHACANDRGAPGADHLDWPGIATALRAINYTGAIAIESFTAENQAIATAASIWRPLAPTQDALARDGLAFLRGTFAG